MFGEMGMIWDRFVAVLLTASPLGDVVVYSVSEEEDDDDDWEDVDVDAEELKITAARPWKE
ncbi:hypothetical protein VMCG_09315 [Cytospora schulzeri]|uniref:Uncharacterized protein n=1 Tax=Cytospora schulzeri TaxID=448051 RepID=A0A423VMC8_9PEZI|nr:hypothetical protein VMCG_09315 [Valsa malicola]